MDETYFWYTPTTIDDVLQILADQGKPISTKGLRVKFVKPDNCTLAVDLILGEPFVYTNSSTDYMQKPDKPGTKQTAKRETSEVVVIAFANGKVREYDIGEKKDWDHLTLKQAQRTLEICERYRLEPPVITGMPIRGLKTPDLSKLTTTGIMPPKPNP